MRSQNRKVAALAAVLLLLGGTSIWYSATGRAVSQDSAQATAAALANNSRSACISARRSDEAAAIGRMVSAASRAQIAGLILHDRAELDRQTAAFDAADIERATASHSLEPEIVNAPTDKGGCGPPITQTSDIPDN